MYDVSRLRRRCILAQIAPLCFLGRDFMRTAALPLRGARQSGAHDCHRQLTHHDDDDKEDLDFMIIHVLGRLLPPSFREVRRLDRREIETRDARTDADRVDDKGGIQTMEVVAARANQAEQARQREKKPSVNSGAVHFWRVIADEQAGDIGSETEKSQSRLDGAEEGEAGSKAHNVKRATAAAILHSVHLATKSRQ